MGWNSPKSLPASGTPDVIISMVYYAVFSSLMLVANKVSISDVPMPACLYCAQFLVTVISVWSFRGLGLAQVDDFTLARIKQWLPYTCSFCISMYCNGKVLQYSNVETVIVFRSCSPLLVSVVEFNFLGRELPSVRSFAALVGVILGAIGYVLSDSQFQMEGVGAYGWVMLYVACTTFEMTFGKFLMDRVQFASPVWGSVLYTNLLSFPLLASLALASQELSRLPSVTVSPMGACALAFSAVGGVGIGWSGWSCRAKVSATTYTLLGVICKLNSVLINVTIWNKHASATGLCWLVVCIIASSFYRQAPLRAAAAHRDAGDKRCPPPQECPLGRPASPEAYEGVEEELERR
mmetsp:Transcript_55717/g.156913  ORF Transcript_55717/g.156913 Transcript_55717/m.156913 type:complete len:350 (-) Transcript_55717:54-1103(-)